MCIPTTPLPTRRVYRLKRSSRALAVVFFVVVPFWVGISPSRGTVEIALAAAFGAYLVAAAFRPAIILTEEAIECRRLFSTSHLLYRDILGRRTFTAHSKYGASRNWKLVPRETGLPTITLGKDFEFDSSFNEWLNRFPDLDEMDMLASKTAGSSAV